MQKPRFLEMNTLYQFRTQLFLVLVALSILTSCETEVDLIAPYKTTPVIVGVLDLSADTQFVRINRTYLTNENAVQYASVKDSVEYDPSEVQARLVKLNNNTEIGSIDLEHITIPSRDPGVFYNEDVSFWYTTETLFSDSELNSIAQNSESPYSYRIDVEVRGETYTAITDFPRLIDGHIAYPSAGLDDIKIDLVQANGNYSQQNFSYRAYSPTYRFQGVFRFNFSYEKNDGSLVENQFIDYQLGVNQLNLSNQNGASQIYPFNPGSWYEYIGPIIKEIPDVKRVRIQNVEVRITGGNRVINDYINIAQPISDFTPTLTTYSNIDGDAIGILGSKTLARSLAILGNKSVELLNDGDDTGGPDGPCYCTEGWAGSNFDCDITICN